MDAAKAPLTMADVRYYLLDGEPERLVKTVDRRGFIWLDGQWKQSNYLGMKVTGAGGDCDFHEVTTEQAERFIAVTPRPCA